MKRINHWLIICFVLLLTVACTSGKQSKSASWQDLHYGPDSLQTMDVYLLENRTADTPLMILVHGGGWMAGDKKDADFMKTACYANGMNVVNINYRMGDGICYKQMMQDMTDAVRYVLVHAEEWNIKKTNYVMWDDRILFSMYQESRLKVFSVIRTCQLIIDIQLRSVTVPRFTGNDWQQSFNIALLCTRQGIQSIQSGRCSQSDD